MNITSTDLILFGLLLVIASQTSYTTYRLWRDGTKPHSGSGGLLVDTSVLMDGRIIAIAETGFLPGKLVIPRSVVGELQFLADNADSEKRERARRGLDVVKRLQDMDGPTVEVLQDGSKASEGVDERLLSLAKKHGMSLCTIDFNLNKVAQVEKIEVLNVNELARNLRMSYLPGDELSLELTTSGSDSHQAVGHLDDGTMVVVEQARSVIGSRQQVVIIRSLQTAAGRMMFAKLAAPSNGKQAQKSPANSSAAAKQKVGSSAANGRKPVSKTKSGAAAKNSKSAATTSSSSGSRGKSKTAPSKSTRGAVSRKPRPQKRSNEDRLIDLVDAQDA